MCFIVTYPSKEGLRCKIQGKKLVLVAETTQQVSTVYLMRKNGRRLDKEPIELARGVGKIEPHHFP